MSDRYAVFGNPVAHSRSPQIHAEFARLTGQSLSYERILAPLDGFAQAVLAFRAAGGRGANVTLPFKREAWQLASACSARAAAAQAVNTLRLDGQAIYGDNTDGAGLVRDLEVNLGQPLPGARVLMLGAGGAAAGVVLPLLERGIARLFIANRTATRAGELAARFVESAGGQAMRAGAAPVDGLREAGPAGSLFSAAPADERSGAAAAAGRVSPAPCVIEAGGFDAVRGEFDLVLNATSASLGAEPPPIAPGAARLAAGVLCYDMMYGTHPSAFLQSAAARGARIADGIGMLIEQAAESFQLWRGVRPDTSGLLAQSAQSWRAAPR